MSLGLKKEKERRIYSGVLQKQCCTSWNCIYTEYIRKCRNGTGYDHLGTALYNIMAVLVLSLFKPGQSGLDKAVLKRTAKGIVTNPIILGIVAGLLWSALGLKMPHIMQKTVTNIGGVATPMGLMAMGATFDIKKAFAKVKPAAVATFMKLISLLAIFLPIAIMLGFRREELVAILVMLGSATTVSCFVMAKNMGHEESLVPML